MVFNPRNIIKRNGAFVFSKEICAMANACVNKEIIKEFWYNYSCQASTLEVKEIKDCAFIIGNAKPLALDDAEYTINIEECGVAINAKDEKTLLAGFMTLLDRFKPVDDNGELAIEIECAEIRDCSLIKNRMIHFCVFPETELWELQKFLRFSAALKFTHVIIEFWGMLRFDCMRELGWKNAYNKDEIRPIIKEAHELGLEIIPMFNHWGHAALARGMYGKHVVLDQNISLATYFSENGWCWAIEKEKVRNLLRAVRNELIELCGEGKYFLIGCDEADGFTYTKEELDFICGFINETSAELKAQGRRAIAWGDMFIHKHKSYNPENVYICKAPTPEIESYMLEHLDKDIIIADWQYDAVNAPVETALTLKNAGFDVLLCPWDENSKVIEACVKTVKDEGLYGFIHTTWHTLSRGTWLIPMVAIGACEDLAARKGYSPTYAAHVLRRVFNANGDYEKAGWSKKQVVDQIT